MHKVIHKLPRTCSILSINNVNSSSATFLPEKLPYTLCPKGKIHTDVPTQQRTVRQAHPHPLPEVQFTRTHQTPEDLTVFLAHSRRKYSSTDPGWQMFKHQAQSLGYLAATGGLLAALGSILYSLSLLLYVYWSFTP